MLQRIPEAKVQALETGDRDQEWDMGHFLLSEWGATNPPYGRVFNDLEGNLRVSHCMFTKTKKGFQIIKASLDDFKGGCGDLTCWAQYSAPEKFLSCIDV